jgi:ribosome-associated protein
MGAVLAGEDRARLAQWADFGESLGMAFQIVDDIFDFVGQERVIGKPTGNDLREGHATLPLIVALRRCAAADRERVLALITSNEYLNGRWNEVLEFVETNGGIEHARQRAATYLEAARDPAGELAAAELARRAAECAFEKKGRDVLILDLQGLSSEVDFFVIVSSLSEPHQKAIVDAVEDALLAEGAKPWHVAGYPKSNWILMDYVDVVVHVFRPDTRDFYSLETLWADAPVERFADEEEDEEEERGKRGRRRD